MQEVRACEDGQHTGWPHEVPKADHLGQGQAARQDAGHARRHGLGCVELEIDLDVGVAADVQIEIDGAASGVERKVGQARVEG